MVITALLASLSISAQPAPGADWIIAHVKGGRIAIDPATGAQRELPVEEPHGVRSPDGLRIAFLGTPQGEESFDIFVADLVPGEGGAPPTKARTRRLTSGLKGTSSLNWTHDSRFVAFEANQDRVQQVYRIDATKQPADGGRPGLQRLEDGQPALWTRDPVGGPDGQVAYVAVREARHKNQECDLVVTDGRRYRTIASGQYVYAHEWRPDGSAIVYSTIASPSALVIHTLADGGEKTFEYSALDEKLHAHTAHNLAWRPDGKALACQITFVGGRLEDADGRIAKIAGDETVFVLTPEDGRLVALPAPGFIARLSWLPREAVERVGQHEVPNEQPR